MKSNKTATVAILSIVGILIIAYGIYIYLYVPPQLSPGGIDKSTDVETTAAWLAGVIVVIGFGAGMIVVAILLVVRSQLVKRAGR